MVILIRKTNIDLINLNTINCKTLKCQNFSYTLKLIFKSKLKVVFFIKIKQKLDNITLFQD